MSAGAGGVPRPIPKPLQALPKLSVLAASTVATLAACVLMIRLPTRPAADAA